MERVGFEILHRVTTELVNHKDNRWLREIGFWYYKYLNLDRDKLSLHIPEFSEGLVESSFNYLRAFSFVYNLSTEDRLQNFEGTCLFNLFDYSRGKPMDELVLEFNRRKDHLLLWGEDVLTNEESFLPVFNREEIISFNKSETINESFNVFTSIARNKLINYPILITLRNKFLSFDNTGCSNFPFTTEKQFLVSEVPNVSSFDDEAMELEDELIAEGLEMSLQLKYPYSKNPHQYLVKTGNKNFKVHFRNRFSYHEINEHDLFLSRSGNFFHKNIEFNIVNTSHTLKLFEKMKYLKEQWTQSNLNRYTTPFPKYWFLFVNDSLDKNEWINQFKKDFPVLVDNPIMNTIEDIVEELIALKWVETVLNDSVKLYFPELKSLRKKRLEFVFGNFKKYVQSINPNVNFVSSLDIEDDLSDVFILDSFNIIELANSSQNFSNEIIRPLVPDYLYYGYQPWIQYHLFNYQNSPSIEGIREEIDDNYSDNRLNYNALKVDLVEKIKSDFRNYKKRLNEVYVEELIEEDDSENLEFDNVEELELIESTFCDQGFQSVLVNNLLRMDAKERVLLQRDSIIYVEAASLIEGDLFLRKDDVKSIIESGFFLERLINIPDSVKNYQRVLYSSLDVYRQLKLRGISYMHESYFNEHYLVEKVNENTFRIPRRKSDWSIICEFLGICNSDKQLSFIAYYGRRRQNELKEMYVSIIEILLDQDLLGEIDNPEVLNVVINQLNAHQEIFNARDNSELRELAEFVVLTIFSELKLKEVKTISYE